MCLSIKRCSRFPQAHAMRPPFLGRIWQGLGNLSASLDQACLWFLCPSVRIRKWPKDKTWPFPLHSHTIRTENHRTGFPQSQDDSPSPWTLRQSFFNRRSCPGLWTCHQRDLGNPVRPVYVSHIMGPIHKRLPEDPYYGPMIEET